SFFAELQTMPHISVLVFDDPVTSLDHAKREIVARRLVHESKHRQVLVFTHDMVFLDALIHEASIQMVPTFFQQVVSGRDGAGRVEVGLPWKGMNTTQRVGELRKLWQDIEKMHRTGADGYDDAVDKLYRKLRDTWERSTEEVLFNGTVLRFRQGIETQRLG